MMWNLVLDSVAATSKFLHKRQHQTDSTNRRNVHVYEDEPYISCPAPERPDTSIRLQRRGPVTRIYGFPSKEPFQMPFSEGFDSFSYCGQITLYLRTTVPAYVDHIMGSNWQDDASILDGEEDQFVFRYQLAPENASDALQPGPESQAEEEAHCRRMLQCGAVLVASKADVEFRLSLFYDTCNQPTEKQIFGWPESGGICVLRNPRIRSYQGTIEESVQRFLADPESVPRRKWEAALEALTGAIDMGAICRIIMEAGGEFYENPTDCPEVLAVGL